MDESGSDLATASSNSDLLGGLDLSDCVDQHKSIHRRAASLAIVRSDAADGPRIIDGASRDHQRASSARHISLSSWLGARSVPPGDHTADSKNQDLPEPEGVKKGKIWYWKPVRALSHIGKRRAGCLFSVEVATVRGVPASMDGHRLSVTVRKEETRDGAVQTMPSRLRDGSVDFDETLFIKCNIYFTGGAGTGKPLKLEPRQFVVSVVAIEAPDLRLGTHTVDVSSLVLDSVEKSSEGRRVRQFDKTFNLSGKASGGELLLKLGFQLMEHAGLSLYSQAETKGASPTRARLHAKNSFSVASATPRVTASDTATSPSMRAYKQLVESLRIDEHRDPLRSPIIRRPDVEEFSATDAGDDSGLPEYEVIDKGVETVKEVVHDQAHRDVLRELDVIAEQIEAIVVLMTNSGMEAPPPTVDHHQHLNSDEETVTREFVRMLEMEEDKDKNMKQPVTPRSGSEKKAADPPVVPDLGRGLGPAVQTRDGGFLVSMNPFDVPLTSRDVTPKLAMQVSRLFVLRSAMAATGFDVLQKMAAAGGADEVREKVASLGEMDDLSGKTPEQVAFEGIAVKVINGRHNEGASSSAARSVQLVRKLAAAVSEGRSELIATGIWSAGDDPETLEEVLVFSLQKLEAMAVQALMIQAEMAEEDAPFDVSAVAGDTSVFESLVSPDDWSESRNSDGRVTLVAAIQLRDPSRGYEVVGAPMVAVVQSARLLGAVGHSAGKFKVRSMHVGGVQVRSSSGAGGSTSWGAERQKLTAMQWLLGHGHGRPGKRMSPRSQAKARQRPDVFWSLSTRVLASMWLKTVRNPDVRIGNGSS